MSPERAKKLAIAIFIVWAVLLTAALIDEGVIQFGGTDFKLQPRTGE